MCVEAPLIRRATVGVQPDSDVSCRTRRDPTKPTWCERLWLCFSLRLLIMKVYIFFLFLLFFPHRPSSSQPYFTAFHITLCFVFFFASEHLFLAPLPPAFFFYFFFSCSARETKKEQKEKTTKIAICACMCFLSDTDRGRKNRGREKTGAAQILALFVVCLLALIHGRSSALLLSFFSFFCCFFSFFQVSECGCWRSRRRVGGPSSQCAPPRRNWMCNPLLCTSGKQR